MSSAEVHPLSANYNGIQYCSNVVLKEVRNERGLVNQTLYTMLSAYTNNPINLAINSPSGEGKSYVMHKVGGLFPSEDVMFVAGMTDKALFHRRGTLVIRNEVGEYETIEEKISKIESEIEDKECEISISTDSNFKQARRNQVKELQEQKNEIRKNARKLIDLSHKIIIFQDTPSPGLLFALMPLLSHDKYEVEYEFVDTFNGIKTKTNILRGWPAVIFAQAIDYTHFKRYPEIERRFIITNPKMSTEKYSDAIKLTAEKFGLPDFAYQEEVVSNEEKERAMNIIKDIKQKILLLADREDPDKNNFIIPFYEQIAASLPAEKAGDMTIAKRLFSLMSLSALVNVDKRPRYLYREDGNPIMQTIPFVTFEDLRESMDFVDYAAIDGVRQYVLEWYNDVFLTTYLTKSEADSKFKNGETRTESRIALTEQLTDATYHIHNKKFSTKQILENYVEPLVNQGYIDKAESDLDRRNKIYYPVKSKIRKLFDSDQSNNLLHQSRILVTNHILFPDRSYIISKIKHVLEYSMHKGINKIEKIMSHDNKEISIEDLVDTYYSNPEDYFIKEGICDEYSQNGKIASELQQISTDDIKPSQLQPVAPEKLFDAPKSNNFLFSCYYYPNCETNDKNEYERHVVIHHPGKPGYPGQADLEHHGLTPKGNSGRFDGWVE